MCGEGGGGGGGAPCMHDIVHRPNDWVPRSFGTLAVGSVVQVLTKYVLSGFQETLEFEAAS